MSEMLKEVAELKQAAIHTAQTGEGGNPDGQADELPKGTSPLQAREETSVGEEAPREEASEGGTESGEAQRAAPAKKIKIGSREFDNESDAYAYAEELDRKVEGAELYNQGIRDAIAAQSQNQPQVEVEDNFEEEFYANPKETLKKVQAQARDEALSIIRAEANKEKLWTQFINENPDIRRKDAERILTENWETIGKMTDLGRAMKVLAQKTRAEYEEIRSLNLPRTELTNKRTATVSSGGSARVTPQKKDDTPLDFVSQMKATFKR